jgi:hypothetical protein
VSRAFARTLYSPKGSPTALSGIATSLDHVFCATDRQLRVFVPVRLGIPGRSSAPRRGPELSGPSRSDAAALAEDRSPPIRRGTEGGQGRD